MLQAIEREGQSATGSGLRMGQVTLTVRDPGKPKACGVVTGVTARPLTVPMPGTSIWCASKDGKVVAYVAYNDTGDNLFVLRFNGEMHVHDSTVRLSSRPTTIQWDENANRPILQ